MTFQVHTTDCLQHMRTMRDNAVDAVVTDPPYGLTFMGKDWDKGVPGEVFWREALRVSKPGAHLLAFGGTRTFHRLTCAIEDAGWEIRDCIMWVYGCLSEDSEVLTREGWVHLHIPTDCGIIMDKEILVYDVQEDVYKWEKPSRWFAYRVNKDTGFRIQSDNTDQLVSRAHRCLVDRGGELAFVMAGELSGVEGVPVLREGVSGVCEGCGRLLQPGVQWRDTRNGLGEACAQGQGGMDGGVTRVFPVQDERGEQPSMARRCDIHQEARELPDNQVCEVSRDISSYGAERRVHNGASSYCGACNGAAADADRGCASCEPQSSRQQDREPCCVCKQPGPQVARARTSYTTDMAVVTEVVYSGAFFCPTVSTGAFVARRNGKVFLTGNSGFPKSLDVSKAIDKAAGAEREVVGHYMPPADSDYYKKGFKPSDPNGGLCHNPTSYGSGAKRLEDRHLTAPATDLARQWQGWGTAIKPAWEPVIMARKPLDGTVAGNVAKWGTGGLNVDGCRVEITERLPEYRTKGGNHSDSVAFGWNGEREIPEGERAQNSVRHRASGRFPANLVHDGSEEVLAGFPDIHGAGGPRDAKGLCGVSGNLFKMAGGDGHRFGDSGSVARFFQCAPSDKVDLLFHRAKCIMSAWSLTQGESECSPKSVSVADASLFQSKSPAVFALSDAVIVASLGAMRLSDVKGLSTTETERELGTLCETLITAILISESDVLPAPQQDVQIPNGCLVRFAEIPKRTDTMMITISRLKSGGFAESVTFCITPNSMGHGVADSATNRFKYCAKASRGEREAGLWWDFEQKARPTMGSGIGGQPDQMRQNNRNIHPTIKPIALMRWLVRLVTPPDGLVLDPFTGSGTTGCAAVLEGKRFIGCELSAEYAEIARARIAHHAAQGVLNLESNNA